MVKWRVKKDQNLEKIQNLIREKDSIELTFKPVKIAKSKSPMRKNHSPIPKGDNFVDYTYNKIMPKPMYAKKKGKLESEMKALDKYLSRMQAGREKKEFLQKALDLRPDYRSSSNNSRSCCRNKENSTSRSRNASASKSRSNSPNYGGSNKTPSKSRSP